MLLKNVIDWPGPAIPSKFLLLKLADFIYWGFGSLNLFKALKNLFILKNKQKGSIFTWRLKTPIYHLRFLIPLIPLLKLLIFTCLHFFHSRNIYTFHFTTKSVIFPMSQDSPERFLVNAISTWSLHNFPELHHFCTEFSSDCSSFSQTRTEVTNQPQELTCLAWRHSSSNQQCDRLISESQFLILFGDEHRYGE